MDVERGATAQGPSRGVPPAQGASARAKRHAPLGGAAADWARDDERGTTAQRRRTVGTQDAGARHNPDGNGEVATSRDPAGDSPPMGTEPRDRLRLGGGVDGSVGVRVRGPLGLQGDPRTAEGGQEVTTSRNPDEDKIPATEKLRGVYCLQVSRDDTGGGTRGTRSFDVPHEEGRGPEGWGPQGPTDWATPARAAWGPEGWGPEHLPKWVRGGTSRETRRDLFAPPGSLRGF